MTRPRVFVLVVVSAAAVAAVAVAACASCGADGAGDDAGTDGGTDAGPDAGPDGGPRDAVGPDIVSPDAGDPNWVLLPGLPASCHAYIARDPRSVLPPLSFVPCSGIASCREVAVDWPVLRHFSLTAPQATAGYHDGTYGHFAFAQSWDGVHILFAVARDDGAIELVVQTVDAVDTLGTDECAATFLSVGDGKFAISVDVRVTPTAPTTMDAAMFGGDLSDPAGSLREIRTWTVDELHGNILADRLVNRDGMIVKWSSSGYAHRLGWDGSDAMLTPPGALVDSLFGATGFMTVLGSPSYLAVARSSGGAAVPLFAPLADGGVPVRLGTDGNDMVWLEGHDATDVLTFGTIDVMTAPFSESDPTGAARSLGAYPPHDAGIAAVGFGHAAIGALGQAFVYRIADGVRTDISPVSPYVWAEASALYIGPTEVATVVMDPRNPAQERIQLIAYAALEPPP